jgi:hypothetical protein
VWYLCGTCVVPVTTVLLVESRRCQGFRTLGQLAGQVGSLLEHIHCFHSGYLYKSISDSEIINPRILGIITPRTILLRNIIILRKVSLRIIMLLLRIILLLRNIIILRKVSLRIIMLLLRIILLLRNIIILRKVSLRIIMLLLRIILLRNIIILRKILLGNNSIIQKYIYPTQTFSRICISPKVADFQFYFL